jgi:prephenate dehydratase
MRVAIQGQRGSYHQAAAETYFGPGVAELICCVTFADVFNALGNGKADAAVIASENSIAGTAHPVYDLLLAHDFYIVGEVYEHIHHCLIGLPGAKLSDITRVYSQSIALPQCSDFLDKNLSTAERIEYSDTAASVAHIKELGDPAYTAVAGARAAKLHELPVLAADIENFANNITRFLVLSAEQPKNSTHTDKASLVLETAHSPGALWHALGVFAHSNANLTKLESRPIAHTPWRYQFLVDVEATPEQLADCITKLEEQKCAVRILGQYTASNKTEI